MENVRGSPVLGAWTRRLLLAPRRLVGYPWTAKQSLGADLRYCDRERERLRAKLLITSDRDARSEIQGDLHGLHFDETIAWEEFEHAESVKLAKEALVLNVGGWPEEEHFYEDKEGSVTDARRLNAKGFEYLRDKVTKEQKRRREAWNDRVGMIVKVIGALTGLGGVAIGIISVSC